MNKEINMIINNQIINPSTLPVWGFVPYLLRVVLAVLGQRVRGRPPRGRRPLQAGEGGGLDVLVVVLRWHAGFLRRDPRLGSPWQGRFRKDTVYRRPYKVDENFCLRKQWE